MRIVRLLSAARVGKAALKAEIASKTSIDVSLLPYDENVVSFIQKMRAAGRRVYLVSASHENYVGGIADHLGLFDGWFASNADKNLSAQSKARRLVETFGERGFDYVGSRTDLAASDFADQCIEANILAEPQTVRASGWFELLRVHQWSKNFLVFVPVVTAQRTDLLTVYEASGAFLAFSLSASAAYILNDLVDLDADRKHSNKLRRPLAAGTVPMTGAVILLPALLIAGLGIAWAISSSLAAVLFVYLNLTTAYSFILKRKMLVDVLALAALYAIRVVGGAVAISVVVSEWLFGFSIFFFTALALIKRYIELAARIDGGMPDLTNRNYRNSDLDIVAALAAAAAFNAVTVFALYISSDAVRLLYSHPRALWLICPILMYWLGRTLMMAHRRLVPDDPILFALRDRNSYIALGLIGLILIGAR